MDAELKTKWLEALRSGKYKQTQDVLRTGSGHCCLGVLCDIIDPNKWTVFDEQGDVVYKYEFPNGDTDTGAIADSYAAELGLDKTVTIEGSWGGSYNDALHGYLAKLNDHDCKTFEEIADYIEANV